MPIYEYRCEPCEHTFETLVRNSGDVAHCPECGSVEVAKQFSVPAAAQNGQASNALAVRNAPSYGCGGGPCGSGMCSME